MLTDIRNVIVLKLRLYLTCSSDEWIVWFVWTELCTIIKAFISFRHLRINTQRHVKSLATYLTWLLCYRLYRSAG